MTNAALLAIEVLLSEGLIERVGTFYKFKESLPVDVRSLTQEKVSEGQLVTGGRLPWLRAIPVEGGYDPRTKEQRLCCAYKLALGLAWDDREWDKFNYARNIRGVKKLLAAFNGNDEEAANWLLEFGDKMRASDLSWTIDTAANHGWNEKGQREAKR